MVSLSGDAPPKKGTTTNMARLTNRAAEALYEALLFRVNDAVRHFQETGERAPLNHVIQTVKESVATLSAFGAIGDTVEALNHCGLVYAPHYENPGEYCFRAYAEMVA